MTRLNGADRQRIVRQLPPKRCKAKANRSGGEQCRRYAVVGADVCPMHGGRAPQVRARAQERVALAAELASGERRPLWEILLDSIHVSDVLARREIAELRLAPEVTAEQVDRLVAAIERSARLSRSGIDAGLAQRRQAFHEAQAAQMARFVEGVVGRLGPTPEQRRELPAAIRAEVRALLAPVDAEVVDDAR